MATAARPLDITTVAEPSAVGRLRRQVRRWLADLIDDTDAVDDLVLAVSEALENVVDHAFVDSAATGSIMVNARRDPDHVVITIADDGHWQSSDGSAPDRFRGRGLSLIDQLAESSDVTTGETGTTVTLTHRC